MKEKKNSSDDWTYFCNVRNPFEHESVYKTHNLDWNLKFNSFFSKMNWKFCHIYNKWYTAIQWMHLNENKTTIYQYTTL